MKETVIKYESYNNQDFSKLLSVPDNKVHQVVEGLKKLKHVTKVEVVKKIEEVEG